MKKIRVLLLDFAKKHHWFMNILRIFMFLFERIKYLYFYFSNKIDNNIILFESYGGRSYSDSPKALYEYLINNKSYNNYKFIWCFTTPLKYEFLNEFSNTEVVKYGSNKYYKYYSKSKYWIVNSRIKETILKKRKQIYIQCWHGIPLKKMGYDIKVKGGNAMNTLSDIKRKYYNDAKRYNYMLSPCKFCTEKFVSAFNLKKLKKENIVLEVGYPRNDFLLNYKKSDISKVKKKLKLPKDKRIILYAPTWRDNQHDSSIGYIYNSCINFDYLKEKLGDEYIILYRNHYFAANKFNSANYGSFIYDVSDYDDINELYIISDILITDYSSVFFDYCILKKPVIFYMYDLDEYKNKLRDFYIDLKELPGNIVFNENELIKEIENTKSFTLSEKYNKFNQKYNYLDDGLSSDRVIKTVLWRKSDEDY